MAFATIGGRVHALAGDIILNREYSDHAIPPGSSWKPELIPDQMRLIASRADVIVPGHGAPFECRPLQAKAAPLRMGDRCDLPNTEKTY